jgi:hypothetical protein
LIEPQKFQQQKLCSALVLRVVTLTKEEKGMANVENHWRIVARTKLVSATFNSVESKTFCSGANEKKEKWSNERVTRLRLVL